MCSPKKDIFEGRTRVWGYVTPEGVRHHLQLSARRFRDHGRAPPKRDLLVGLTDPGRLL
jgi:hypothetical protein